MIAVVASVFSGFVMRLVLVALTAFVAIVSGQDDSRSQESPVPDSEHLEPYVTPDPALQEYIICRQCGADIGDSYYVHNRESPNAVVSSNITLFSKKGVDIQTLTNPLGIKFRIINTSKALCIGIGDWVPAHSWYPGFVWKFCVCPHCSAHLGWIFEPISSATPDTNSPTDEGFYGIIVDNVLGEKLVQSLLVNPTAIRS